MLDRTQSEEEDEIEAEERSGVYRPPRLAAMPYVEAPAKGASRASPSLVSHSKLYD